MEFVEANHIRLKFLRKAQNLGQLYFVREDRMSFRLLAGEMKACMQHYRIRLSVLYFCLYNSCFFGVSAGILLRDPGCPGIFPFASITSCSTTPSARCLSSLVLRSDMS